MRQKITLREVGLRDGLQIIAQLESLASLRQLFG